MADDDNITKTCVRCHEVKPLAEFVRPRNSEARYLGRCLVCDRARILAWRMANAEQYKARCQAYSKANAERVKKRCAAWYLANWQYARTKQAAWAKANAALVSAQSKAWAKANPYKDRASKAKWRDAHRGKVSTYAAHRRARERAAEGSFTGEEADDIRRMQRDKCAVCRCPLKGRGHLDHIVSLVNGGSNNRRNLQWLCQPCNQQKRARDPIEFMQARGLLL